jgi:hypothetical protein
MAVYPEPIPKAQIVESFRRRLADLQRYAAGEGDAVNNASPSRWFRPSDFDESPQNVDAISGPFFRGELYEQFVLSVKDPEAAGTVGDLSLIQLQGDFLACMERAFRARHHSSCRSRAHAAGRLRGHGHPYGVISQGLLRYVQALDFANRGEDIK